jgi:hypothetical protein
MNKWSSFNELNLTNQSHFEVAELRQVFFGWGGLFKLEFETEFQTDYIFRSKKGTDFAHCSCE